MVVEHKGVFDGLQASLKGGFGIVEGLQVAKGRRQRRSQGALQHRVVQHHRQTRTVRVGGQRRPFRLAQTQAMVIVQQRVEGKALDGQTCAVGHVRPGRQIDEDGQQVGPRLHRARCKLEEVFRQTTCFVEPVVLVGPIAGQFHHPGLVAVAGHHDVQQSVVGGRKRLVFLREQSVAQQDPDLAFHRDVVAGHGLSEVGQGVGHTALACDQFGQFKMHQAPIWAPLEQGIQFLFCRVQVLGGHEPTGQLQLQDVAVGEVPQGAVQELAQGLGVGGLFHNAQRFQPHILVASHLGFVVVEQVQGGQDVPF